MVQTCDRCGSRYLILKEDTAKTFNQRCPEKVTMQGITGQKISILQSTLVPFNIDGRS